MTRMEVFRPKLTEPEIEALQSKIAAALIVMKVMGWPGRPWPTGAHQARL